MIEFNWYRRHRDGTPIVRNVDVIAFAEAQLKDYRPELLEKPGKIDALHFIESYLKANVDFQDIYYEEGENAIAGATVFNDESIRVFDRENQCVKDISVPAGTVIIDNKTMEAGKEGFARFTQLHEAGHFCMHKTVYCKNPGQMELFANGLAARSVVLCKRESIEQTRHKLVTQEDFREHQANVYAAALEMPRAPFKRLVTDLIAEYDIGRERNQMLVIPRVADYHFSIGLEEIVSKVAEAFGASRTAVRVQMQSRGILMTESQYLRAYDAYRLGKEYR